MKKPTEHTINNRTLETFDTIESELLLHKDKNYLFNLSHMGVLDVNGDRAIEFLQGQLTCDLKSISDIEMIQGAQCNLKGRILSLLDIVCWDGIKLILPRDLLEATQNSLIKPAQLSRVSINQNNDLAILGFYLQNQNDLLPANLSFFSKELYAQAQGNDFCYYHLGNGFYIFIIKADKVDEFCVPFIAHQQYSGSLTWHTLRLNHRQIDIYPQSRGVFLPHRLSLHETKYLSFDKGCYKGQEIIARTQYRATIKHELQINSITTNEPLFAGQLVFKKDEDIELGELVDYSYLGSGRYLIAVSIKKDTVDSVRFQNHSHSVILEKPLSL